MDQQQFSIEINAPREMVWNTLWDDKTFRDWASLIDEGTYMVGELKEGNKVQCISSVSGYGVTSFIEKLSPNEFIAFKHLVDTMESGGRERKNEWTGASESYSLKENDGVTTLTLIIDIPPEQEEVFQIRLPKALERIKFLTEENK